MAKQQADLEPDRAAVDAALHYADYARRALRDDAGTWKGKHGTRAPGDRAIDLQEWETRPEKCMQILAAEVRRLRAIVPDAEGRAAR
jgi:hypothetical protein